MHKKPGQSALRSARSVANATMRSLNGKSLSLSSIDISSKSRCDNGLSVRSISNGIGDAVRGVKLALPPPLSVLSEGSGWGRVHIRTAPS